MTTEPGDWPFLRAEITFSNPCTLTLDRLEVHPSNSSLNMLWPVLVAPKGQVQAQILLPPSEDGNYLFVAHSSEVNKGCLFSCTTSVPWPTEQLQASRSAFIDPDAYRQYDSLPAGWPEGTRRGVILVLVVATILGGGLLFVRRSWLQLPLAAVVVCLATFGVWKVASAEPDVVNLADGPASVVAPNKQTIVLSARRETRATVPPDFYPVYRNAAAMSRDQAVISPEGISIPLKPGEIRVFRKRGTGD